MLSSLIVLVCLVVLSFATRVVISLAMCWKAVRIARKMWHILPFADWERAGDTVFWTNGGIRWSIGYDLVWFNNVNEFLSPSAWCSHSIIGWYWHRKYIWWFRKNIDLKHIPGWK